MVICDHNPKVFSAKYLHLVPEGGSSFLQIFDITETWRTGIYCFVVVSFACLFGLFWVRVVFVCVEFFGVCCVDFCAYFFRLVWLVLICWFALFFF